MSFSRRLSHNVFLTTFSFNVFLSMSCSQRLFHNLFLTTSCSHRCPNIFVHNVTIISLYVLCSDRRTNTPKISQISLYSDPRNFDIFWLIKFAFAHLQYIFVHCVKFQNPRTKASYQSAADKLLYKYPKISQIRLSSNPRNFDDF